MLRLDLRDYNDVYIVVKERISFTGTNAANRRNKKLTFRNNATFRSSISNINNTFTDNVEDLDIVMLMFKLSEYTDSYSMTSGSLWNYYRDELKNDDDYRVNNEKTATKKSFEFKTRRIRSTPADNSRLEAEVVVPLKYLSTFWRSHNLLLINCEIEVNFS